MYNKKINMSLCLAAGQAQSPTVKIILLCFSYGLFTWRISARAEISVRSLWKTTQPRLGFSAWVNWLRNLKEIPGLEMEFQPG